MRIDDPIETDPRTLEEREDEMRRELRWAEFEQFVKQARVPTLLRHVADLMDGRRDPYHITLNVVVMLESFAETEQWSGVLLAITRALKEDEAAKRELMDRR